MLKGINDFKSFVEYLGSFKGDLGTREHIHFENQYNFIYDNNGNNILDFVGRFENLQDDFNTVLQKINFQGDTILPTKHKTDHLSYRDFYDEQTKDIVEQLYKKDIETFNYEF